MHSLAGAAAPPLPTLAPRHAYNLAARQYDAWHWQEFWRRNEVPVVRALVGRGATPGEVLDLGTGTGLYLGGFIADRWDGVGVDVSEGMLTVARAKLGASARLVQAEATALPLRRSTFDVVVAARVMSHVSDLRGALAEAARVTRTGGLLTLTDVDPAHDYAATRIAVGDQLVYIDTYKWTAQQIIAAAHEVGYSFKRAKRLTAKNVAWLPDDESFRSIDRSGSRPIGHILVFRRVSRPRPFALRRG
jgi:ubiquinone/menaquinone biosynthesis C-methylase UbiE